MMNCFDEPKLNPSIVKGDLKRNYKVEIVHIFGVDSTCTIQHDIYSIYSPLNSKVEL